MELNYRNLGDLLDWCRVRRLGKDWPAVVTQDEYTHDVIVPSEDGRYLVYEAT